ncbi:hypothetical protein CEXT_67981 [Caerostris extrusa]|uniref:Uncharacterized protein n=1 Tax=Caerostris extrusa TaxID=172846 RepID=A0AAV4VRW0_CAEEX|nr:hypothetical protein CEXT_67981 [Caerostris extrusa]
MTDSLKSTRGEHLALIRKSSVPTLSRELVNRGLLTRVLNWDTRIMMAVPGTLPLSSDSSSSPLLIGALSPPVRYTRRSTVISGCKRVEWLKYYAFVIYKECYLKHV